MFTIPYINDNTNCSKQAERVEHEKPQFIEVDCIKITSRLDSQRTYYDSTKSTTININQICRFYSGLDTIYCYPSNRTKYDTYEYTVVELESSTIFVALPYKKFKQLLNIE